MKRTLFLTAAAVAALGTMHSTAAADADDRRVYQPEPRVYGVVRWFKPFNVQLYRGPHLFLHQGTIINPTGIHLQPGMDVVVYGHWNGNDSMNADRIDVLPPGHFRRIEDAR